MRDAGPTNGPGGRPSVESPDFSPAPRLTGWGLCQTVAVAKLDNQTIEAVRESADLVELVGGRVALTRRGGRWWGCCPFHEERSPSFSLIPPDSRRYFCFGCGATGDAINWMIDKEGVGSFQEAIESLAERFGVPIRYEQTSPQEDAERKVSERRIELLDRAATYYVQCLWGMDEAAPAREYLHGRGFGEEILRRYRVGYAPSSGRALAERAMSGGFNRAQLSDAGLARGSGDFFQGRIMFPIGDARGRVLGFGGRVMPGADGPKYVNSPEGPRFRKRELLYGLHEARPAAAKVGWVAVVEGYTDVLALALAGVDSAVACMGTSLTSQQLREVKRVAGEVRLCFDSDAAGESAAWRTVEAGKGIPLRLSALKLPPGSDPGDLAARPEGLPVLKEITDAPEPLIVALVRSRCRRAGPTSTERDQAFGDIERLIGMVGASLERDEAIRLAVSLLAIPPGLAARLGAASGQLAKAGATLPALGRDDEMERGLLGLALASGAVGKAALGGLPGGTFENLDHRRAAALIAEGVDPETWPDTLTALAGALRSRGADEVDEAELLEAVLRLQERALERRLASSRESGDEARMIQTQTLLNRVRAALRDQRRGPE